LFEVNWFKDVYKTHHIVLQVLWAWLNVIIDASPRNRRRLPPPPLSFQV